jgi:hypothetical protein
MRTWTALTGDDSYRRRPIISSDPTTWKPEPRSSKQRKNVTYLSATYKDALEGAGIQKLGVTRLFRRGAAVRLTGMR